MALELSIIVPAYNEAHRLTDGLKRFNAAVDDGCVDIEQTEVLVIDDGSRDGTAATARSLLAHLPHHRVVSLSSNQGKGAAVRAGIRLARSTATAYMDADMAIDPRAVPHLLGALQTSEVAIGSRALADSMVDGTYAVRAVMGRMFNRMVTTGTGLDLLDTQCGFKAFRTPIARLLFHLVRIDRFAFDVELLARSKRLGLRVTEVPVHWKNVPGSTIHPLHDSISMLGDVYKSRLGLTATPRLRVVDVEGPRDPRGQGLAERTATALVRVLPDISLPMLVEGSRVSTLFPLVDPADSSMATTALRATFGTAHVRTRSLDLAGLSRLGPLTGRLLDSVAVAHQA
jgi:glycosyltransferase involved in cell wall biosynthesis